MSGSNGARVVVWSTDWCGFCVRAKALLEERGVAYREEHVQRTTEGLARMTAAVPGARTFPQIVIDGAPVGGFRELVELDRAGGLEPLREGAS